MGRREWALSLAVIAAMLFPVGAIGGASRWAQAITCGLFVIVALLVVRHKWRHRRPIYVSYVPLALGVASLYTLLQVVPLPFGLLELLSPATAELLTFSLGELGGPRSAEPISLDPSATLWEAAKLLSCVLAFIVAENWGSRRRVSEVYTAFLGAGAVITVIALLGAIVAPGKILFFRGTPFVGQNVPLITTTFVNSNHSAAFLNICTLIGMGLVARPGGVLQCVPAMVATGFCGLGSVLSLSKGGILSLCAGLCVFAAFVAFPSEKQKRGGPMIAVVVGLALLLGVGFVAYDSIVAEFVGSMDRWNKTALWPFGLEMINANWLVGVGRGAFIHGFPRYLGDAILPNVTFSHLENEYLHLPAEWGLLVSTGVFAVFLIAMTRMVSVARKSELWAAAFAALVAIGLHAWVDFNLELLGIAIPVMVLFGSLAAARRTDVAVKVELEKKRRGVRHGAWITAAMCVLSTAVTAWAVSRGAESYKEVDMAIAALAELPFKQAVERAEPIIRAHPADFLPHLAVAESSRRSKRGRPLAWVNRARYLNPKAFQPHLMAAKGLFDLGRRRQALLEMKWAIGRGAPVDEALNWILDRYDQVDDVQRGLPDDPKVHVRVIELLYPRKRLRDASEIVSRARTRWPRSKILIDSELSVLIAQRDPRAEAIARRLVEQSPTVEHHDLLAWSLLPRGDDAQIPVLKEAVARYPRNIHLGLRLAREYYRAHRREEALEKAESLLNWRPSVVEVVKIYEFLAEVSDADGKPHRAAYYRQSMRAVKRRVARQ